MESESTTAVLRLERLSGTITSNENAVADPQTKRNPPNEKWKAGDKAEIEYGSKWAPVTILKVYPNGIVRLHWHGWDEDVAPTRLHPGAMQKSLKGLSTANAPTLTVRGSELGVFCVEGVTVVGISWSGESAGRYPNFWTDVSDRVTDPESDSKRKVVLEVGGKRCKVAAIEFWLP